MASERYLLAMRDVNEGGLSARAAAIKHGLKRSALLDRLNGIVEYDQRAGPRPILSKSEESQFAQWLIEMSNRGFGLNKDAFKESVKKFLDKDGRSTPFPNNKPGEKWYRSFCKRNPEVKNRKARPLEKKRAAITKQEVDNWFTEYESFVEEKGLSNSPSQIWNCDETGFELQGRAGNVIGPSKVKMAPYRVLSGSKEHITVLPCFNACGQWLPPYFLFPGKRVPVTYNPLEGGVQGSVFSVTESGWMDTQSFYKWLANHFIPNLTPARPVLLLVDSHDSHIDYDTFKLAEDNGILLYALLKNATHLVQPADVGLFGPMKQSWYKSVREYTQKNPNSEVNKKNFCSVLKPTWEQVMSPATLVNAFRKSGIYPIDRSQVAHSLIASSPSSEPGDKPTTEQGQIVSPAKEALNAFEAVLDSPVRTKYHRRIENGYSLEGSPTYKTWKALYKSSNELQDLDTKQSQSTTPLSASSAARRTTPPSVPTPEVTLQEQASSSVLREILVHPTIKPKEPSKSKNYKRNIPNFLNGPESMQLLLNEKLKKARELKDKQDRMKKAEQLKSEREKKKLEEKAKKEQKQREREEKRQILLEEKQAKKRKRDHARTGRKQDTPKKLRPSCERNKGNQICQVMDTDIEFVMNHH